MTTLEISLTITTFVLLFSNIIRKKINRKLVNKLNRLNKQYKTIESQFIYERENALFLSKVIDGFKQHCPWCQKKTLQMNGKCTDCMGKHNESPIKTK